MRPAPLLTEDNAFFWEAATSHRLVAQRCADCGRYRHPPRPMCPACNSMAVDIVELRGRGTIYSFSVIHHPPSPFFEYPVLAVLVELEEGIRLVSNLVGVDAAAIAGTSLIGRAVEVEFTPTANDQAVPVFRLANGSNDEHAA
jgi:uncharacterized OB-fold protein